jgi:hypothetical protein
MGSRLYKLISKLAILVYQPLNFKVKCIIRAVVITRKIPQPQKKDAVALAPGCRCNAIGRPGDGACAFNVKEK